MTDPMRLVSVILYVNDLARSRAYYEDRLGLRPVAGPEGSAHYDVGHALLCLRRAAEHGITLAPSRDNSADVVFLVGDLAHTRAALEGRGVKLTPTVRYEIGGIADFYDPDGHWLTIYEPSAKAMGWPSGRKIREVMAARAPDLPNGDAAPLAGKELLYLFLFVRDADATARFYHDGLGLAYLEGGPCSQGLTSNDEGVIKYDAGGVMVATHHTEGTVYTDGGEATEPEPEPSEHTCPPRTLDAAHTKGIAPVFYVADLEKAVADLSGRGVAFPNGAVRLGDGAWAQFEDPSGHQFYLYQPSPAALNGPGGSRLGQIMAARWTAAEAICRATEAGGRVVV
jgi:catechol 2,3-dioxygenase-like lactoylglutathione lyase family enzyme